MIVFRDLLWLEIEPALAWETETGVLTHHQYAAMQV